MISSVVKTKSIEVKDKVKDYITHTSTESSNSIPRLIIWFLLNLSINFCFLNRHVSKQDKVSKLYRQDQTSVFSLDGDNDDGKIKNKFS